MQASDAEAIDTIASILNDDEWTYDHLDAVAKVLDAVREVQADKWALHGAPLVWRHPHYVKAE